MGKTILNMKNVSKSFGGVEVVKNVNFELEAGEVHILIGENGAGKSTLMKILTGVHNMDAGEIHLRKGNDEELTKVEITNPKTAQDLGVSMVFQESNLLGNISIAENMYMGREPLKRGIIDWSRMYADTAEQLKRVKSDLSPKTLVDSLSVAEKQVVEIAKSLSTNSKIIIFDEPTSSLSDREVNILFDLINEAKKHGVAIIYISHRMEEIFEIGDRITVLRDGQYIATLNIKDTNEQEIVKLMIGRELVNEKLDKVVEIDHTNVALKINNVCIKGSKDPVNLELYKGEILGVFGLIGAGRTELARIIFGIDSKSTGEIWKNGVKLNIRRPQDAIENGIGLIPEDRRKFGLIGMMPVRYNLVIIKLRQLRRLLFSDKQETDITNEYIKKLSISLHSQMQPAERLSGGNQQKVVISKWLAVNPDILIMDEPTRGIDVGAKSEIYSLMQDLVQQGVSILMISSDLPEILRVSDRVIVMHDYRITLTGNAKDLTQEQIMQAAIS